MVSKLFFRNALISGGNCLYIYISLEAKLLLHDPQSHQATDSEIKMIDSYQCGDTYSERFILLN